MSKIIEQNRQGDLYLDGGSYTGGRVIFIPQGWGDDFKDENAADDGPSIYGWIGQPTVSNWLTHPHKEWFTYDAQGWVPVAELEQMRQITEAEARQLDPDLFRLLDAVNSGEAN